jgi:hypothetical protein
MLHHRKNKEICLQSQDNRREWNHHKRGLGNCAGKKQTSAIRQLHDFLTVGAAAPLQEAAAVALRLPERYYVRLASMYLEKSNGC